MNLNQYPGLLATVGVTFSILSISSAANALTFNEAGPSANNVDTNPATVVPLNVTTTGIIDDLNLSIQLNGTLFWTDLDISLSHNGTTVQVYQGPQNDQSGSFNVAFDDEATNIIPTGGNAIGVFQPFQSLSAFDGQELSGLWELEILDDYVSNEGNQLVSWSISNPVNAPVSSSVPFEFSPSLGILVVMGVFGGNYLRNKKHYGVNKL